MTSIKQLLLNHTVLQTNTKLKQNIKYISMNQYICLSVHVHLFSNPSFYRYIFLSIHRLTIMDYVPGQILCKVVFKAIYIFIIYLSILYIYLVYRSSFLLNYLSSVILFIYLTIYLSI